MTVKPSWSTHKRNPNGWRGARLSVCLLCAGLVMSSISIAQIRISPFSRDFQYTLCDLKKRLTFINLRSGPSLQDPIIGQLSIGTWMTIDDSSGRWRHVLTGDGLVGWASARFLCPGFPANMIGSMVFGTMKTCGLDPAGDNFLALLARPDSKIGDVRLGPNMPLQVLESSRRYLRVKLLDGRTGWVYRKYTCTK